MIENVKRNKRGLVLAATMIVTMWWLVLSAKWIETEPIWVAAVGTGFLTVGAVGEVIWDWYQNPAYSVDGWEDSERST